MNTTTMKRLIQSIQLLKLDGFNEFTNKQLSQASGVTTKTIERNSTLIDIFTFTLSKEEYNRCLLQH